MDTLLPHHGVASRRALLTHLSQAEIQRLVRTGGLRRVRRGWYATPTAQPVVVSAVAAGGVLGCVSALAWHDVWVPVSDRLHVRARPAAHRGPRRFCRQFGRPEPEGAAVDGLDTALRHAVRCLDDEGIVVVCDSLLNLNLMSRAGIEACLAGAPARIRSLVDRCDQAESGTETMVRLRLRSLGIEVRAQVWIDGVGRADLLVGDRLILEIDGRAYHVGSDRFEADRERDRNAVERGYLVIRLTYNQVLHEWPAAEAAILAIVRRRMHRTSTPPPHHRSQRRTG